MTSYIGVVHSQPVRISKVPVTLGYFPLQDSNHKYQPKAGTFQLEF